jgi:hypothetical protein
MQLAAMKNKKMHPDKSTGTLLQKMIQHPRQITEIQNDIV